MTEFVIAGMQRSGTNVLTEFFNSHPGFFVANEIFHPGMVGIDSYNSFLERIKSTTIAQTDLEKRQSNFDAFVKFLRAETGKEHIGYNVKYSSLHHLDGEWKAISTPPNMIQFFRERGVKIIHVIRRNLFDASLSALVAEQTGIWHKRPHDNYTLSKILVDPAKLVNNIRLAINEISRFKHYTEDFHDIVEIEYEKMFENEQFSDSLALKLCNTFGVTDLFDRKPALDRISKFSYETIVANYADVMAHTKANGLS